jgi:hypothetical protein
MKKVIIAAAIMCVAVTGWAQGTVDFRNGVDDVDRLVYRDAVGGTALGADASLGEVRESSWKAALFFVPGADGDISQAVMTGLAENFQSSTSSRAGQWRNDVGGINRTLAGVAGGDTATLQVRVWDSRAGATFDEAVAGGGLWGASEAFNYTVPTGLTTPDQFFMKGLQAFALVPEPSVIALGVLGAASLLLFRRRK